MNALKPKFAVFRNYHFLYVSFTLTYEKEERREQILKTN